MSEVNNSSKSFMYNHLINHFALQLYLSKSIYYQHMYKKLICKLRLSSHCLCVENGRYKNVPLERRICPMCKSDMEDEYHFMLKCPAFNNLRKRCLKPYYFQRPSVYKLTQLLSTRNVKELSNVDKFIKFAFKERKSM